MITKRKISDEHFFDLLAMESGFAELSISKTVFLGLLRVMKRQLMDRGEVYMPLWGTFKILLRKERRAFDYNTGVRIIIPPYKAVTFKASKRLYGYFKDSDAVVPRKNKLRRKIQ